MARPPQAPGLPRRDAPSGRAGAAAAPDGPGAHAATSPVVYADILLRLDDPALEAAYWRQPHAMGGPEYDLACCIIAAFLQVAFVNSAAGGSSGSALKGFQAAHRALALLPLLHAALIVGARRAYLRRRARVQAAIRLGRLCFNLYQAHFTRQFAAAAQARFALLAASSPAKAIAFSLLLVPVTLLAHSLLNPCPIALHPAVFAVIALCLPGWAPAACEPWRHAQTAAAARALAERLAAAQLFVDSAALAAFGAPLSYGSSAAAAEGLSKARAASLILNLWLALVMASLALGVLLIYSFELRSKQQYLRSQGLKLRVRVPFTDWLAARLAPRADGPVVAAAAAARGGPWPATIAAAAAPLLLWQVAQLLTSWRQPSCWPAIDGA